MCLFYQWLDYYAGVAFKGTVRESLKKINQDELMVSFNQIMRSIYKEENKNKIDFNAFFNRLRTEINRTEKNQSSFFLVDLKLN